MGNEKGDELVLGFDQSNKQYYVDRSKSGNTNFNSAFIHRTVSPRISDHKTISYRLLVDHNSVEIFADGGISNLSNLFFVEQPFDVLNLKSLHPVGIKDLKVKIIK
ncbi:hypothetical protein D9M72_649140 [compost metagenome]